MPNRTLVPIMVTTPAALADMVARCFSCDCVALDTEFVWERTYYAKLGIVQVALDGEVCFLVDAVALGDLQPLGALLSTDTVTKILHDAPQDLTILRRASGACAAKVFDTRSAAGLAGLSSTTSLAELVKETVGVELPKTESRTDWLQRPLTTPQVQYAAEDVCYLHAVRDELVRRVAGLGRLEWLAEELGALDDPALYLDRDPMEQYLRVKGAGRASRRELAVLRELAAWREQEARAVDRPRSRVVGDSVLVYLARRRPVDHDALAGIKGLASRYADAVLACVARGLEVPPEACPARRQRPRPADEEMADSLVAAAMALLRTRAEAARIDPPFLATRAEVRALVLAGPSAPPAAHRVLRGWRRQVVGDQLLALLNRKEAP